MARTRNELLSGSAILTDDDSSATLITNTQNLYTYLDKVNISVYKASRGGAGVLEIATHDGTVVYRVSTSKVENITLDFGEGGLKVGTEKNTGLQALVSGSTTQASLSVAVSCHLENK